MTFIASLHAQTMLELVHQVKTAELRQRLTTFTTRAAHYSLVIIGLNDRWSFLQRKVKDLGDRATSRYKAQKSIFNYHWIQPNLKQENERNTINSCYCIHLQIKNKCIGNKILKVLTKTLQTNLCTKWTDRIVYIKNLPSLQ